MKRKKIQKKNVNVKETASKHNEHIQNEHIFEIRGIFFIAFGLIVFLSFYLKNSIGLFGVFLREVLLGLLGFPALIIPFTLFAYGIFLIVRQKEHRVLNRVIHAVALFILVSTLIHAMLYKPDDYLNMKPMACISMFYTEGSELIGGGVLGGLLSLPFLLIFQKIGTIIIFSAITLVEIILLTNTSMANFFNNLLTLFKRVPKPQKGKSESPVYMNTFDKNSNTGYSKTINSKPKNKIVDFEIIKSLKEDSYNDETEDYMEPVIKKIRHSDKTEKIEKAENTEKNQKEQADATASAAAKKILEIAHKADNLQPYKKPPLDLLKDLSEKSNNAKTYRNQVIEGAKKLEETLSSFGVSAKVINVTRGPAVTRYELQPSAGVKVSRIVNLADDISLNLASSGVRIEAPIPGKAAIGIEVPNKEVNMVGLREILESQEFERNTSKIAFSLGKDISGECIVTDIAKMPHLLIAGATGSGKSVCINSLIVSLLYRSTPDEVRLLMIDPKVVELGVYNGIPHLLIPVVTEPKKAAGALNWAVQEMVSRYKTFAEKSVRDLAGYNEYVRKNNEGVTLPQIVIIIDELSDLMMVAPNDVEDAICRLAQMARAAGMHLVIATQRPSVDVITGVIKANIPSRISFAVSSQVDSRTILDMGGAEKLQGRGDMLFHPVGRQKPVRIQGANITDAEVEKVVDFLKNQGAAEYDETVLEGINNSDTVGHKSETDDDELLPKAISLVVDAGQASVSLIQRKFKVGYARAARIVDQMEERGIVGGFEGSKPRQILISRQAWHEMQMSDKQ